MSPRPSKPVLVSGSNSSSNWSSTTRAGSWRRRKTRKSVEICCSDFRRKNPGSLALRLLKIDAITSGRVVYAPILNQTK